MKFSTFAISALALISVLSVIEAESEGELPERVQSRPIVIKLPSPSVVDTRTLVKKPERVEQVEDSDEKPKVAPKKESDSGEPKPKVTAPKKNSDSEESQPKAIPRIPAVKVSLSATTVRPVALTPSSFRQEVVASPGVALSSGLSSFPNPLLSSGGSSSLGLQQAALSRNGLNPPIPGLLSNQFGSQSGLIGPGSPPLPNANGNSGILNVLNSLGRQLTGAVGLNGILPQNSPQQFPQASPQFPQISRIPGAPGPPIAGIPNIPGLPLFPGAGGAPNGQIDFLSLFSAISRRAFNGSSLSDVLPPNQAQKFADNITGVILPNTADIDLSKFMGRWFEGINSPRATDQRCVVHHYGGLTENGKTATFTALKIYREGSEFGQVRYSIGYAFKGGRQDGMLQMHSSEASDPTPYWIYRVGPVGKDPFGNEQYEYAIISNWIRYPVMVLVRDPDQFRQKYEEEVLKWLEDNAFINGFVRIFNLVQPVDYANCQYADSTFEVFG